MRDQEAYSGHHFGKSHSSNTQKTTEVPFIHHRREGEECSKMAYLGENVRIGLIT